MFDLNDLSIIKISEVPESWVYKHFYKKFSGGIPIEKKFDGRIIKVKSLKNRDSTPSLCFFYKNGHYYWKDFSSGDPGGGIVDFVMYHGNKYEGTAINIICSEYEAYLTSPLEEDFEEYIADEITKPEFNIVTDTHNENSLGYFNRFKIDLECLNRFKMRRGARYKILRGSKEYIFDRTFFFAFYNSKGAYQLYQPENKEIKYINIDTSYMIGEEQLEFKSDTCIIISGLKDIAAISMIKELRCEYVASHSEMALLSKDRMDFLRSKYKFILSMLDNDLAGMKAMNLYKKAYGIPYVYVPLKKDLAENNEHWPLEKLRYQYTDLIQKKLANYGSEN